MLEGRIGRKKELTYEQPITPERYDIPSWCGYTTFGMATQSLGYPDITPQRIFEEVHKVKLDSKAERERANTGPANRRLHPGITHLVAVVKDLTDLEAGVYDMEKYTKLQERRPEITPLTVINSQFIGKEARCIVRLPYHYNILQKITVPPGDVKEQIKNATYTFIDPLSGEYIRRSRETFEHHWGQGEDDYPTKDPRYLMAVVYKKDKK